MSNTIPCTIPAHGVKSHVAGSQAAIDCLASAASWGHSKTTIPSTVPSSSSVEQPHIDMMIKSINEKATASNGLSLIYVDRQTELGNDQINQYLVNDLAYREYISDRFAEHEWLSAREIASEVIRDAGLEPDEYEKDHSDEYERLLQKIYELANDDPLPQMLRNTPHKVMRASIKDEFPAMTESQTEEKEAYVLARLSDSASVDVSDRGVQEAVSRLVASGPREWHQGVRLDVIWYGDIQVPALTDEGDRRLSFEGAHIVLMDEWNGTGESELIEGNLAVTVTTDWPAFLDSDSASGFGWDDIAGIDPIAYRPNSIKAEIKKD